MLELLAQAVELRATGLAWEFVAAKLLREAATCRNWPSQYRAEWRRLYAEAERRLTGEAGAEARVYLRKLLRSDDEKISLAAAKLLLADRPKPQPRPRQPDAAVSRQNADFLADLRRMTDAELDQCIRGFLADQSVPAGTAAPASAAQSQ
jgi:hypothetical protein